MIDIVHTREKVEIYMYTVVNTYGAYTSNSQQHQARTSQQSQFIFFIFQAKQAIINNVPGLCKNK